MQITTPTIRPNMFSWHTTVAFKKVHYSHFTTHKTQKINLKLSEYISTQHNVVSKTRKLNQNCQKYVKTFRKVQNLTRVS